MVEYVLQWLLVAMLIVAYLLCVSTDFHLTAECGSRFKVMTINITQSTVIFAFVVLFFYLCGAFDALR